MFEQIIDQMTDDSMRLREIMPPAAAARSAVRRLAASRR
jgi:hypothetical protein